MIICDLAAIEYRVVGWMSSCQAIWDVVKNDRDPYLDFAQKLYANKNYKYDALKKRYAEEDPEIIEVRQNSKPPVLGGGYGLGKGELITNQFGDEVRSGLWGYALNVCGVDMPLNLAGEAVKIYRETNYEVVQFWADLENAFKWTLRKGEPVVVGEVMWNKFDRCWSPCTNNFTGCKIRFSRIKSKSNGYIIRIELPSGRALHYLNAQIKKEEKFGRVGETIYYEGIEHSQTTDEDGNVAKKNFKWGLTKTYGGKICENICQAIARDILVHGCHLARDAGFKLIGVFHDEIATEVENSWLAPNLENLIDCMTTPPDWGKTLILGAEGFTSSFYRKG